MPCIVFILDTSGSMSTKSYNNLTFFQVAQNYIELFIRTRSRGDATRGSLDRYVLLTTSERYPENIKLCGKEMVPQVHEQLRLLSPHGTSQVHLSVLDAFKFMHVNRSQTAIDGYGWGRTLQNSENVILVLITDGTGVAGIPENFKLELEPHFLGSELTKEAYRWDQKLFSVVLRIPPTPVRVMPTQNQQIIIDIDVAEIERLCSLTGGRSMSIRSQKQLIPSIELLIAQIQHHRVGVRFECHNTISRNTKAEDLNKVRQKFRRAAEKKPVTQLILRNHGGRAAIHHWCIPESFWPMRNLDSLQPRDAHPVILIATEPIIIPLRNDLPLDRVDIEPPSVALEFAMEALSNKKDACLPVYVANSSNNPGSLIPFGALRLVMGTVALFLHGWNYPMLYSIVDDLKKDPNQANSAVWRDRVNHYMSEVPVYQSGATKKIFVKYRLRGGRMEEADSMSATYAPGLVAYLNKLKSQGKEEFDRIGTVCQLKNEMDMKRPQDPIVRLEKISSRTRLKGLKISRNDEEEEEDDGEPADLEEYDPAGNGVVQIQNYMITLCLVKSKKPDSILRNPFEPTTLDMVMALPKMEANCNLMFNPPPVNVLDGAKPGMKTWFHSLEDLHNLPIASMGNYDEYIKGKIECGGGPLREVIEAPKRTQVFGNPYKVKSFGAGIDEVMDSQVTDAPSVRRDKRAGENLEKSVGPPKKKKGPLGGDAFGKWRDQRAIAATPGSTPATSRAPSPTPLNGKEDVEMKEQVDELSRRMERTSREETAVTVPLTTIPSTTNGKMRMEGKPPPTTLMTPPPAVPTTSPVPSPQPTEPELTWEEVTEKKKAIGGLIMDATADAREKVLSMIYTSPSDHYDLLRYAIREANRFRMREFAKELEQLWSSNALPEPM